LITVRLAIVPADLLRMHEEPEPDRVKRVVKSVKGSGLVKKAIAVDAKTMVVLDGVHRLSALKELGCVRIPVTLLDYSSEDVLVYAKGSTRLLPKERVIDAAISGDKLPPKSTRHMIREADGRLVHISKLEKDVSIPLSTLRLPS
jgi:L-serine kinase (ADP)